MNPTKTATVTLALLIFAVGASGVATAANDTTSMNATATQTPAETTPQTQTQTPTPTESAKSTGDQSTATQAPSTGAESEQSNCDPSIGSPKMSQSRLYAPEKSVSAGSPGKIAGGFQVDPTASCSVVVNLNLQVPSGMTITGASDALSGGAGMVTSTFEVRPRGGVKDLRANVYSSNTGDRTVTADIVYWPKGHKDMAKEIDGVALTFDVSEPTTPEPGSRSAETVGDTSNDSSVGAGDVSNGSLLSPNMFIAVAIILVVIVAIVAMATNSGSKIVNAINK